MATSQLESVLDTLKLLPLTLNRNLELISELDKQCYELQSTIDKLQSKIKTIFEETYTNKQILKIDSALSSELRSKQQTISVLSAEKLAIAKECRDIIVSYIQRIDEDMDFIEKDAPAGSLDTGDTLTNALTSSVSSMFDDTYNKYGSKSTMIGTQHRQAAAKGIKAPRIDALTNDDINTNTQSQRQGIRRKSAAYAMDTMSVALDSTDDDDEESSYLPSQHYNRVTHGLANTGINSDMTVDMNDIQLMGQNVEEDMNTGESGDNTLYCTCRNTSYGEMVGCDDENCKYEWFHFGCVGLKAKPKGKWYCPDCTQRRASQQVAAQMMY